MAAIFKTPEQQICMSQMINQQDSKLDFLAQSIWWIQWIPVAVMVWNTACLWWYLLQTRCIFCIWGNICLSGCFCTMHISCLWCFEVWNIYWWAVLKLLRYVFKSNKELWYPVLPCITLYYPILLCYLSSLAILYRSWYAGYGDICIQLDQARILWDWSLHRIIAIQSTLKQIWYSICYVYIPPWSTSKAISVIEDKGHILEYGCVGVIQWA